MNSNFDNQLNAVLLNYFNDSLDLSHEDILQIKESINLYKNIKKHLEDDMPVFGKRRKKKHIDEIKEIDKILENLYKSLYCCENDIKFYTEIIEKKILEK